MACLANEPFLLNVIKRGGDMLAKDLAARLLEYPEEEISVSQEMSLIGDIKSTLTLNRDIFKKKVKFNYDWREDLL